jgi:hypothetical protein
MGHLYLKSFISFGHLSLCHWCIGLLGLYRLLGILLNHYSILSIALIHYNTLSFNHYSIESF